MRAIFRFLQSLEQFIQERALLIQTVGVIVAIAISIVAIGVSIYLGESSSQDMSALRKRVHEVSEAVERAANSLKDSVGQVNTAVEATTTAVEAVEESADTLNDSVQTVNNSVQNTTAAVEAVEESADTLNDSVQTVNNSVQNTTAAVEAVEESADTLNDSVQTVNNSVQTVDGSVRGTTNAVNILDGSVNDLTETVREIEDPKLRAGDLISVGPRRVGEEDRVFLVAEVNGTDVTLRWITTWDVLDQSGCEGRLIRLLTNREVSQLAITPGAHIGSAAGGCFASLISGS